MYTTVFILRQGAENNAVKNSTVIDVGELAKKKKDKEKGKEKEDEEK